MGNKYTPQDYINMIHKYLSNNVLRAVNIQEIANYCIDLTVRGSELDAGDEKKIEQLVKKTLSYLTGYGLIKFGKESYFVDKDILKADGFIFEEEKPMNPVDKKILSRLDEIDRNSSINRDPICDIPTIDKEMGDD